MIHPTSKFVLLKWVPKGDSISILLPDGARPSTGGDFIVQAVGPDVPLIPLLKVGTKVMLRADVQLSGVDEKKKLGIVHYDWIMAVVDEKLDLPTDEQIRQLTGN